MAIATITHVAGTETLTGTPGRTLDYGFLLTNTSGGALRLSIEVRPQAPAETGWFEIQGAVERDLETGQTENLTVKVTLPPATPPGRYAFRLRGYLTDDRERTIESPELVLQVPAANTPQPTPSKGGKVPWWAVAGGIGTILVIGGIIAALLIIDGKPTMPELAGKSVKEAVALLNKDKIGFQIYEEFTGTVDSGQVIRQEPAPGTPMESGDFATLHVEIISVATPSLVDLSIPQAEQRLIAEGLALGAVSEEESTSAQGGAVLRHTPAANERVLPGTSIAVVVAKELVTVNSLVGQTVTEAGQSLVAQGLRQGSVTQRRTGGTPGVVLSHTPAAGARVSAGTAVALVVEDQMVRVPNFLGTPQTDATATLTQLGLRVGTVTHLTQGKPAGSVLAQRPAPGSEIAVGSSIDLDVERRRPVVRPDPAIMLPNSHLLEQIQNPRTQFIGGTLRAVPPDDGQ
ncbi:PASTA domain-containing protein [Thioalkalicoccus limnaeus]|uniref:PASTA domain-containing protein n=1 Tax=Thioalkalicoccus limnaeus TaxID=120681 RepID=A0ABV4BMP5_9GAMM